MPNVNVYTDNWNATGTTPSKSQYKMDVTIQWTDENGKLQEASETTHWPDILDNIDPELVEEMMRELLVKSLRNKAGVDRLPELTEV